MYRLRDTGIQKRVSSRIYLEKPMCLSKGSNFVSVGLLDCYGAFMIFGFGLACSLIVFVVEFIWSKYLNDRCKRTIEDMQRRRSKRMQTARRFTVQPFNEECTMRDAWKISRVANGIFYLVMCCRRKTIEDFFLRLSTFATKYAFSSFHFTTTHTYDNRNRKTIGFPFHASNIIVININANK